MQDNEPLMRALSNLINLNQPDLVLFVGEALVGNDAVDQLSKFNSRLADLSQVSSCRGRWVCEVCRHWQAPRAATVIRAFFWQRAASIQL